MDSRAPYNLYLGTLTATVTPKHVRRINLRIRADGTVTMSIPWHMSRAEAQSFLDDHATWVLEHVESAKARSASMCKDGRVPLWGMLATLPDGTTSDELYRRELAKRLPEVVTRMEAATHQHASGWQVRLMKTRWGSCTPSTGRIRINARLAAYPPTCLDYVVAHELTHLAEPSHNERFHRLLALAYPDEPHARTLLRRDPLSLAETSGRQAHE